MITFFIFFFSAVLFIAVANIVACVYESGKARDIRDRHLQDNPIRMDCNRIISECKDSFNHTF